MWATNCASNSTLKVVRFHSTMKIGHFFLARLAFDLPKCREPWGGGGGAVGGEPGRGGFKKGFKREVLTPFLTPPSVKGRGHAFCWTTLRWPSLDNPSTGPHRTGPLLDRQIFVVLSSSTALLVDKMTPKRALSMGHALEPRPQFHETLAEERKNAIPPFGPEHSGS